MAIQNLSAASLAILLVVLSPFANANNTNSANALSEQDIHSIRLSLQELKFDDRQFSNQDLEFLVQSGLDLRDLEANRKLLRERNESALTCHSTKCHMPF